jgi:hypothetical protein
MTSAMVLADEDWHLDADLAIVRLAKTEPEFTADELRKILRPAPNPNWVGLAFGRASRNGLIEPVAYQTSTSKTRRHGSLKVWRRKEGAS